MNGFVDKKTLVILRSATARFRAHLRPTTVMGGELYHWRALSRDPAFEEALDELLEITLTIADRAAPADGADVSPFQAEREQMVSARDGFREVK